MFGKIIVKSDIEYPMATHVYLNDEELHGIRCVEYRQAVDEVPQFKLELLRLPDIDMFGHVEFEYTPKTIQEAMRIVRDALINDEDFMAAFISSIESSVSDQGLSSKIPFEDTLSIASKIMTRIMGDTDGNSENNIGDC